ncbi:AraC family transcriptional regulator [Opitutaceae bacterium TAV5]|nr:AraC family transcriptional regulator [Opitutaceae bacterium TAV5]
MSKRSSSPAASGSPAFVPLPGVPSWVGGIVDMPDHYHGLNWSSAVMPNNFLFFVRQGPHEMMPMSVTFSVHHRYELVVAYAGEGRVCVEDRIYALQPGTALLLRPGEFHHYFGFSAERFAWLFFTFDLAEDSGLTEAAGVPRHLEMTDLALISETGRSWVAGQRSGRAVFEMGLRMGRLLEAMAERANVEPLAEPAGDEREACTMLRTLAHFVDRRMDQALRIGDLADHLGISESNLRKLFRERFGVSLGSYLRRSRLTRSVQLIHRTDMSVSEVARLCGFESIFSFSQAFRRAIGMPPSAYRRHLAEGRPPIIPGTVPEADEVPDFSE